MGYKYEIAPSCFLYCVVFLSRSSCPGILGIFYIGDIMRAKKFKLTPFPTVLRLKFADEELEDGTLGITSMSGSTIEVVICTCDEEKLLSTIIHESVHVV